MSEQTKTRTLQDIQQEYSQLQLKLGAAQYQVNCHKKDAEMICDTMRSLTAEFNAAKLAAEKAAAELAAKAPPAAATPSSPQPSAEKPKRGRKPKLVVEGGPSNG